MRSPSALLVFVLGSAGCHNCGHHDPIEESETDALDDSCGFICTSGGFDSSGGVGGVTTLPAGDTGGESSSSTTGTAAPQNECRMSAECDGGMFCVAPFDQALGPEGKGAYACVAECVPLVDEDLWCADATACCDPNAICTDRGYCELPGSGGTDDTGGSDTGSTGDSGTTGMADESGSGSGSTGG